MKVLYAAAECAPFIKTGGLADVIGALPREMTKNGVDVRVIVPLHKGVSDEFKDKMEFLGEFYVSLSWRKTYCGVYSLFYNGVTHYFIDNEQYFGRNSIYGEYDDAERFAFFSKAVLDVINFVDFFPEVIHINDWHTALVPVYLDEFYREDPRYSRIKTVLSIHNIEYQGRYNPVILGEVFGLSENRLATLMYDNDLNLLKGGIESSDMIITVSETYAKEILDVTHSFGLCGILREREYKLRGIVNGIDTETYNPETDSAIYKNYNYETIRFKSFNKKALQKEMGLAVDNTIPLIGMVTRLTRQKGIDLIQEVRDEIKDLPIQLIVLGLGDDDFEWFLRDFEWSSHENIRGYVGFSKEIAQKIYAASDIFLMPSRSEPCGLSQMIAMRYGTIPVVHSVGGLKDTVEPFNPETMSGTGITFQSYNAYDMLDAIKRALLLYADKGSWRMLRKNAMQKDFSWEQSSLKYLDVYKEVIE